MEEGVVEKEDIASGNTGEYHHDTERIVCEWLEYRDFLHAGDGVSREYLGGTIIVEFLFREGIHLFARHVPDIREIDGIHRDEAK